MCWFFGSQGKGKWQNAGGASLETFEESLQVLALVVWQRSLHRPCLQHQTHKLSWVEHHGWSKIIYQNHKSYSLTTLHHFTSISRPILSPWISLNASALCQHGRSAWLISVWKAYIENNLTPNIHSLQDFFQDVANRGVLNLPIAGKDEDVLIKTVGDFSSVK